jgi:hypothetical protein
MVTKRIFLPCHDHTTSFLGAFAKLRKANISFFISVCPSVRLSLRMAERDSDKTDLRGH